MTWWGVRLDGVALINLIMCIGFSVDFRYNNLQNDLFLLYQTTVLLHKIHLHSPSYEWCTRHASFWIGFKAYSSDKYYWIWGHMRGIWVLFPMRYGSLISFGEWLSDILKWRGMFADPRSAHCAKQFAKQFLFYCENGSSQGFLHVTQMFVGVGQAIIPYLKEEIQGYLLIWKSGL